MVVTCSCMAADCHNGTSSCRNANHVCCSATIPILLVLSSRRGRAALGRGGCGTHQLALRVLPEKEQPSLPASLVFSGGPFFYSACNACVRAGGGRCGLPRQRSYACRRRRRRALASGRSMGTIGRSRRLGTAWYNSVDQVRPQGKYATAADSDTAAAAQAARRPRVWRRRRLRRCQRRRTA